MKQLSALLSLLLFATILVLVSCGNNEDQFQNLTGTYIGTATINEKVYYDYEMIFDTTYVVTDQLKVSGIDISKRIYNMDLVSNFRTYYNGVPMQAADFELDENFTIWYGFDEYGYTVDNKQHFVFDPQQDTVYFRLAHFPYGPTIVDDPDSIGHYHEILHEWDYVLSAKR